jgi:hypothetical protein
VAGGAVLGLNAGVDPGVPGEDEERADRGTGGRSGGQPGVDVELGAVACGPLVGVMQPGQELDGFGDLLLGCAHWAAPGGAGFAFGADAVEVVPGREALDGPGDLSRQGSELGFDPVLESRQVRIAVRQCACVDEQGSEMFDSVTMAMFVEALVGERDRAMPMP